MKQSRLNGRTGSSLTTLEDAGKQKRSMGWARNEHIGLAMVTRESGSDIGHQCAEREASMSTSMDCSIIWGLTVATRQGPQVGHAKTKSEDGVEGREENIGRRWMGSECVVAHTNRTQKARERKWKSKGTTPINPFKYICHPSDQ